MKSYLLMEYNGYYWVRIQFDEVCAFNLNITEFEQVVNQAKQTKKILYDDWKIQLEDSELSELCLKLTRLKNYCKCQDDKLVVVGTAVDDCGRPLWYDLGCPEHKLFIKRKYVCESSKECES